MLKIKKHISDSPFKRNCIKQTEVEENSKESEVEMILTCLQWAAANYGNLLVFSVWSLTSQERKPTGKATASKSLCNMLFLGQHVQTSRLDAITHTHRLYDACEQIQNIQMFLHIYEKKHSSKWNLQLFQPRLLDYVHSKLLKSVKERWSFHDCINKHLCSFGVVLPRKKKSWNMTRLVAWTWSSNKFPIALAQNVPSGEKGRDALKLHNHL